MGVVRIALLLCVFAVILRDAHAVKCFTCVHAEFPSGVPNIYKNPYCKEHSLKSLIYAGDDCPDDGKDYVCAKVSGMYTFDVPNVGITNVESVIRRCLVRPEGFDDKDHSGKCMVSDALDKATNDIDLIGASADVGDMTKFSGNVCFCNGNNCNSASEIGRHAMIVALMMGTLASLMIRRLIN